MDKQFQLVPLGINELHEKVRKAESLLTELKLLIKEISESKVEITLKPL